ncbi:MAG: thiol peroxidase [Helicobacteraceae bacterium]|nr:thiol peroxidase [Helicobacteraceae bacterium]
MKKIVFLCVCVFSLSFADNFQANFAKAIKDSSGVSVSVLVKKELESLGGLYFVIGKTQGGDIFPVIVSGDGKYFIGLSSVMHFSKKDSKVIKDSIAKASKDKEEADLVALNKLFKTFSKDDFIFLEGASKNLPTKIIITDPDCPYCRDELKNAEKQLKEANLKLIFAPVHDKAAFIKAQLALNEGKKAKSTKEKLEILRKYYKDIELSQTQLRTDIKQVQNTTKVIFDSGLVRGVPFIFEEK